MDNIKSDSTYLKVNPVCDIDESILSFDTTISDTFSKNLKKTVLLKPVYVKVVDGIEQLVYNSRIMEYNQKYRVTWNDDEFILVRNEYSVDMYKFFPEK